MVERKPIDASLVERWAARSREDIEAASRLIKDGFLRRGVSILYESGFRVCLGHVALAGFRIRSAPGHHRAAIEAARGICGVEFDLILGRLDRFRRFRNDDLYGTSPVPGETDARQALKDALELVSSIESALRDK